MHTNTLENIYCWQIMECGDTACPVQLQRVAECWEYMQEHPGVPCRNGPCKDCVVYLCKNKQFSFSHRDLEQILLWRTTKSGKLDIL